MAGLKTRLWTALRALSWRTRFWVGLVTALLLGVAVGYGIRPPSTEELLSEAEAGEARVMERIEQVEKDLQGARTQLYDLGH